MAALLRLSRPFRSLTSPLRVRHSPLPSKFFSSRLNVPPRSRAFRSQSYFHPAGREAENRKVLFTLIGANVCVYAYGVYVRQVAMGGDVLPFSRFVKNMTLNLNEFRGGAWWPALTSTFTHLSFSHLLSNMISVYFVGKLLATSPRLTPAHYLLIAVGGGLTGAAGYLGNRYWLQRQKGTPDMSRGLGFSGAVMSISTVTACLAPKARMLLMGFIPMPLWGLVTGYAVYDGYFLNDPNTRTAHAGHLGGLAFGILYYVLKLRGMKMMRV